MKKVLIRKLNRTLLFKEGTKEKYINGAQLAQFFGFYGCKPPDKRSDAFAKQTIYNKSDVTSCECPRAFQISVTTEASDIRVTGDYLDALEADGMLEVDNVIFEQVERNNNKIYLFDYIRKDLSFVMQLYSKEDDFDNYNIVTTPSYKATLKPRAHQYPCEYWKWDDHITDKDWKKMIANPFEAYIYLNGVEVIKLIRIREDSTSFEKYLKGKSNNANSPITQNKKLYFIEEDDGTGWKTLNFNNEQKIEFNICKNNGVIYVEIYSRDINSIKYYERGRENEVLHYYNGQ